MTQEDARTATINQLRVAVEITECNIVEQEATYGLPADMFRARMVYLLKELSLRQK
jgi:hypothetical protein